MNTYTIAPFAQRIGVSIKTLQLCRTHGCEILVMNTSSTREVRGKIVDHVNRLIGYC